MKEEKFKLIAAVHLVLIRGNKTLLQRRMNTGYEDGNYGLIAGHHDGNEPLTEAIIREAYEESKIKLNKDNLKLSHVMHKTVHDERIDFFFTAEGWEGTPIINEKNKADQLKWFPLDNLPQNTIPYIKAALENIQKGIFYSEFGWEVIDKS